MAFRLFSDVYETSTTGGTGNQVLAGALDGSYNTFASRYSDTWQAFACLKQGTARELSLITYNAGANSITRTQVYKSTNSNALVNFTGGQAVAIFVTEIAPSDLDLAGLQLLLASMGEHPAAGNIYGGKITESHATGTVTFAVKTISGNDPSAGEPVLILFPDGNLRAITASLSIAFAGTIGATNNVPFRVWLTLHDNAGTLSLGMRQCVSGANVTGFPGNGIMTTTANLAGGSAGVTYQGNTLTSKPFVIVAMAEYESGLATVGTWGVSPTRIILCGYNTAKPGDILGRTLGTFASTTSTTGTTYVTGGLSVSVTPTSPCNGFKVSANGQLRQSTSSVRAIAQLARNSNSNMFGSVGVAITTSGLIIAPCTLTGIDFPGTTSSTSYIAMIKDGSGGTTIWADNQETEILAEEIMG